MNEFKEWDLDSDSWKTDQETKTNMEIILLVIICVLLSLAIILNLVLRNKEGNELPQLQNKVTELQTSLSKIEYYYDSKTKAFPTRTIPF